MLGGGCSGWLGDPPTSLASKGGSSAGQLHQLCGAPLGLDGTKRWSPWQARRSPLGRRVRSWVGAMPGLPRVLRHDRAGGAYLVKNLSDGRQNLRVVAKRLVHLR